MVNTTDTYWDINGTSLNTLGWNIETLGAGRTGVAPLRGADLVIPYREGEVWLPKIADSRDITLGMWVAGRDEDGIPHPSGDVEAQWQENFDMLRNLMWSSNSTLTLTKRFRRGGDIVAASAEVQFSRGFDPDFPAKGLSRFTVTFHMTDPFFYGEEVEVELVDGIPNTITVEGDVPTHMIFIDTVAGAVVTNQTPTPDVSISSSVDAILDVRNKRVSGASVPSLINTQGSDQWFYLTPGSNTLLCDGGDVTLTYQPAYF